MFPRIGKWLMAHGMMNPVMVQQVLEFQKHGEHKLFGQIALNREMVNGRNLREYMRDKRLHG